MDGATKELLQRFTSRRRWLLISDDAKLLHDLRISGDDLLSLWKAFDPKQEIDMLGFKVDEYFPPEVGLDSFLLTALGSLPLANRVLKKYKEFPVRWLEELKNSGNWRAIVHE